jgi:uncharacterized membrane protein YwzB
VLYFIFSLASINLVISYVSSNIHVVSHYFFNITAIFILTLIIRNYNKLYKKNKSSNTKILLFAFSLLLLSHLIFIPARVGVLFVAANFISLISYVVLLFLMIRILEHGKKKKPHGYNIRHAGDNTRKRRKD